MRLSLEWMLPAALVGSLVALVAVIGWIKHKAYAWRLVYSISALAAAVHFMFAVYRICGMDLLRAGSRAATLAQLFPLVGWALLLFWVLPAERRKFPGLMTTVAAPTRESVQPQPVAPFTFIGGWPRGEAAELLDRLAQANVTFQIAQNRRAAHEGDVLILTEIYVHEKDKPIADEVVGRFETDP